MAIDNSTPTPPEKCSGDDINLPVESRSDALAELQRGMRIAFGAFNRAWEFELENSEHGYRLAVADQRRVQSIIARFQQEIHAALSAPRLESSRSTTGLRLVIGNKR